MNKRTRNRQQALSFRTLKIKPGDTFTFIPTEGENSYITIFVDNIQPPARSRTLFKLNDAIQVTVDNIVYCTYNTNLIWSIKISGANLNEEGVVYSLLLYDFRANGFHAFVNGEYSFTMSSKME